MEPIRSVKNPRVVAAADLRRTRTRRRRGATLLEGPHLLEAAAAADVSVSAIFALVDDERSRDLAATIGAEWIPVTPVVLGRLAPTEHPRGPVAVMEIPATRPPSRDALALAVRDPGNAGTLIRTAAAFGLDVVVVDGAVDPWSPKVLRAAAGAHFRVALGREVPSGWRTIATLPRGGCDLDDLQGRLDPRRRWAILVGDEAHGLPPDLAASAEVAVSIPMEAGTESLNAAVAGALVAYELRRWRTRAGNPSSPD